MNKQPYISIAIPCYDINGKGGEVLDYSMNIINNQTFKDIEVVISDHSKIGENDVENIYNKWKNNLNIIYFRNSDTIGSPSVNTNYSIALSNGKLIKLLCQDDYLSDEYSIEKTVNSFTDKYDWLISSYIHSKDRKNFYYRHSPTVCQNIHIENLIGTPSCVCIRNKKDNIIFDNKLRFMYDCEYYYRMRRVYGEPKILDDITMVNYIWEGQVTSTFSDKDFYNEKVYVIKKINRMKKIDNICKI